MNKPFTSLRGQKELYQLLDQLQITFDYYEHPPAPTIEEAKKYWKDIEAIHCKNLFFRNHKGNQHYLVVIDHRYELNIHDLERRLKQGKLSFASEARMEKYLGVKPGSVSPLALINDREKHVFVFLDENLRHARKISFHPNDNTASIVMLFPDFIKFLNFVGNKYEFISLYQAIQAN
ncbi:MAG: prolyl-tRNA synthetase associated domain-containing protein [Bacteroidales bacterium]